VCIEFEFGAENVGDVAVRQMSLEKCRFEKTDVRKHFEASQNISWLSAA
jgi:hypothetical protein